jgi:hypothetical protein
MLRFDERWRFRDESDCYCEREKTVDDLRIVLQTKEWMIRLVSAERGE